MYDRRDEIDRKEYRKKRKKTQRTLAVMLIVFFLLSLAFATVSAALAFRVHSLGQKVVKLEEQLLQEQKKSELFGQTSSQNPPVGAGDAPNESESGSGSGENGSDLQPAGSETDSTLKSSEPSEEGDTKPSKESTEAATETASKETTEKKEASDAPWAEKEIYLTFDDGPSGHTDQILELLAEYDAKATFFVIGRTDENSKKMYQQIVDDGHTLAIHSYSHKYKEIYASVDAFSKDFMKLSDLLYDVTGKRPTLSRFPGGSSNKVSKLGITPFIKYLNEQGIVYFDWNVETGDATGKPYTADELTENALEGIEKFKRPVVLMHDTDAKKATLESLPDLLAAIAEKGGQMLALDGDVTPVQHVKADSVK